jgi:hypothetical protein
MDPIFYVTVLLGACAAAIMIVHAVTVHRAKR